VLDGKSATVSRAVPAPAVSVVIPTHNRPGALGETLRGLVNQSLPVAEYEILVVDDGSDPPVELPAGFEGPARILRLEGVERSRARNAGAAVTRGELLVFLDDDISVEADFLASHLAAAEEWPGALVVGPIRLPQEVLSTPFGQFRAQLEAIGNLERGPCRSENLCTAANCSISRARFDQLGGFDPGLISSEDQDLALRHTASSGIIVFLPEAVAVHRDHVTEFHGYLRRTEWGARQMVPYILKRPELPENGERLRVNGPVAPGSEPLRATLSKLAKRVMRISPLLCALLGLVKLLEKTAPRSRALPRVYSALIGSAIYRGHLAGLSLFGDLQAAGTAGQPSLGRERGAGCDA
jgi:GT2 family glycosyltransferase